MAQRISITLVFAFLTVQANAQQAAPRPDRFGPLILRVLAGIPAGWRARETYTILSNDEFTERFELAEPGRDFELYSEARLKRVR
jgi:hypothetical protein